MGLREGLTLSKVTGTDVSNLPPSGWCVVCARGRTAGEGVWAGQPGPGVSNSAKRMLSGCWGGRAGGRRTG